LTLARAQSSKGSVGAAHRGSVSAMLAVSSEQRRAGERFFRNGDRVVVH
jgi:hypothetical protein